ncbi:DnaQ-like DNA polymerase III subunit [Arthrobacter phage Rings]|uniref:DnaQ-like DNA polymerase III subunit n=4 Tax=Amigovirus amigo TaxID=1982100 RepID=A0A0U4IND6_9CAUD|nr:DnaQ-like DNA polymerase III subunit [Arthrobacter phage Anansi]ALY09105.1 DnaQ-like DNA polymerase III subunit [Arthrobacter phage Gorgeous]ALY10122.1 DnaQ-like DNA polymerase III subunit [Arthrobacter phage Rings]ALY10386.1 DnaQ-like DNA polymerase III subunit [Arthrobacter phage SorJuana]
MNFAEMLQQDASTSAAKRAKENNVRILTIDIENSPNLAHVWGLWNNNVSLSQLMEAGEVISFAAKWAGDDEVMFHSNYHDGHDAMIKRAYELVNEADIIVGYNSQGFDMKHLQREFVVAGYAPTTPYKNVDLLHAVKRNFRFVSNKLDYVVQELKLGAKTQHAGHTLWVQCMAGDKDAWDKMREYNIQDVVITEKLYYRILPWIEKHPHIGMYLSSDKDRCPFCGGTERELQEQTAKAYVSTYQLFRCSECSGLFKSTWRGRDKDRLFTAKVKVSQ